jgi:hypothetical protein
VTVSASGAYAIFAEPRDEPRDAECDQRERALRYGWAEPLSFARRGFTLFAGAAVAPPSGVGPCLLLHGDTHDAALILLAFSSLGWSILGDRYTPAMWEGDRLIAYPHEAPILISKRRAAKRGLEGTKVREHTDALEVDLPRWTTPIAVGAMVMLRVARVDDPTLHELVGYERFEAAVGYRIGGVLGGGGQASEVPPKDVLAEHLRLAALPAVRLSFREDRLDADVAELVAWWGEHCAPAGSP